MVTNEYNSQCRGQTKKNGMNAKEVLANVVAMIAEGEEYNAQNKRRGLKMRWRIYDVCDRLSIFDWWNEYLSVSQLKQMRKFLETAITMGYTGFVCFKVGAAGCSHGMWAHKQESEDGYSPDGECLYHSFVSGANDWDIKLADGTWLHDRDGRCNHSLREVKAALIA